MDKNSSPLAAGFSGAVLLALLASPFTSGRQAGAPETTTAPAAKAEGAPGSDGQTPNFNSDGPWYAICREYLTSEKPEESQAPSHKVDVPGFHVHVEPLEADSAMKEYASKLPETNAQKQKETNKQEQKYQVRYHLADDLSACTSINPKIAVKVVVATVPDPLATHMQLMTDREIDAIGEGAAIEKYALTSYWLPWRTDGETKGGKEGANDSEAEKSRLQEPGVLIYRPEEDEKTVWSARYLFVFLVGETPTGGVNRLQMARALRDADQILGADKSPSLLLLGPNFSGTYRSLGDVLSDSVWMKKAGRQVVAISPGTSDQDAIHRFRTLGETEDKPCEVGRLMLVSLSLNSVRIEQIAKLELQSKFAIQEDEIAWLSEDESAIGAHLFLDSDRPGSPQVGDRVLHLQYPRDLSSLRNSSDPGALLVSPADLTGSPQASHAISLTLGDKASGELDSPPAYAANQEAIRAEAALERIVERMHERRIQAVVVTASNPLDQLFLLDYLRRSMPDVRLVTEDADEFMMQRPEHVSLIGTLVLTGLPLLPGEVTNRQSPSSSDTLLHPLLHVGLPSSNASGQFLGIRLLLQNPDDRARAMALLMPEANESHARGQDEFDQRSGRAVSENPLDTDRGLPIEDLGSFIEGRFGLEPLEGSNLFTHYPIGEPVAYIGATVNPFPTGWLFVLGFIGLLTRWHIWAVRVSEKPWKTVKVGGKDKEVWRASKWAYPPEPDEPEALKGKLGWEPLNAYRKYYLCIACNQVTLLEFAAWTVTAVLLLNFGWLYFEGASRMDLPVQFTTANFIWIMILFALHTWLLGMAALESLRMRRSFGRGGEAFAGQRFVALMTRIFFVASALVWMSVLTRTTRWIPHASSLKDIAAVALRCASPMHGLSPFVPFAAVLLAYLTWAWLHLERLGTACSKRVWIAPNTDQEGGVFAKDGVLEKLHQELHGQLQSCFPEQDALQLVLFIAWIFGLCLIGAWNATAGLDGLGFHWWILFFGMFMLLLTCALEVLSAYRRWWSFKALLDYLERSPIAVDFSGDALKMEVGSMKIWQVGKMPHTLLIQSHILDTLTADDREKGKKLICEWLTQHSEGWRVRASIAHDLSVLLNGPLVERAKILEEPRPEMAADWLWSQQVRYLTLRYLSLMPYAMVQIRNSLTFVLWGFAATVVCVASYPFQGAHAIGGFISVGCLATLAAIAMLLVRIERHPLLSRLEGSSAGKASFLQVAGQLLSIGGLPLIAVLASQFPAMGDFLLSWVRPVLEAGH